MAPQINTIKIRGVVQGVGFRPFIFRLAKSAGFAGSVKNTSDGVLIQLQCSQDELLSFVNSIKNNLPPLASISSIKFSSDHNGLHFSDFSILESASETKVKTSIPEDTAVCQECIKELKDPSDRRYRHPFINCTNCGPRFSIIESLPYDRPNTSMKMFKPCQLCSQEYNNPGSRRFHAQPIACWSCGPSLSWHDSHGTEIKSSNCLKSATSALGQGKIVAIKGLGGFHLAASATNKEAIKTLRQRKGRKSKPLAIMVKDLNTARQYGEISKQEEKLLISSKSPIVLVRKNSGYDLPENLAPYISEIGIMLPYTPLHHLLFPAGITTLVMTSGNKSSEPICTDNEKALEKLADIADFFLFHDRQIVTRVDDSVVRFVAGKPRILRRSRGYVPEPTNLDKNSKMIIGCGAGLKSTFALTRGKEAFISQHIGDLDSPEALDFYQESVDHLKQVYEIEPEIVVTDLHPDYLSSRWGKNLKLPLLKVQHHHAHAAAVAAEHNLSEPLIGVVFDGTGFGPDQTIWGGEILLLNKNSYQRLAHIDHFLLPGGDWAAKEPWRIAVAMLYKLYGEEITTELVSQHLPEIPESDISFLLQMIKTGVNCPRASSCGRLFDGVSALINLRMTVDYEGQAAMELEALTWESIRNDDFLTILKDYPCYDLKIMEKNSIQAFDVHLLIQAIIADKQQGVARGIIALKFHLWLIKSVTTLLSVHKTADKRPVVLSGGCMQNRLLLEGLWAELTRLNFRVYAGEKIPMNDGGISFGQVAIGD